jgi:hypothetical protein
VPLILQRPICALALPKRMLCALLLDASRCSKRSLCLPKKYLGPASKLLREERSRIGEMGGRVHDFCHVGKVRMGKVRAKFSEVCPPISGYSSMCVCVCAYTIREESEKRENKEEEEGRGREETEGEGECVRACARARAREKSRRAKHRRRNTPGRGLMAKS